MRKYFSKTVPSTLARLLAAYLHTRYADVYNRCHFKTRTTILATIVYNKYSYTISSTPTFCTNVLRSTLVKHFSYFFHWHIFMYEIPHQPPQKSHTIWEKGQGPGACFHICESGVVSAKAFYLLLYSIALRTHSLSTL